MWGAAFRCCRDDGSRPLGGATQRRQGAAVARSEPCGHIAMCVLRETRGCPRHGLLGAPEAGEAPQTEASQTCLWGKLQTRRNGSLWTGLNRARRQTLHLVTEMPTPSGMRCGLSSSNAVGDLTPRETPLVPHFTFPFPISASQMHGSGFFRKINRGLGHPQPVCSPDSQRMRVGLSRCAGGGEA